MLNSDPHFPVNADPLLSQTLERAIAQLKKDDSLRKASPKQIARRKDLLADQFDDPDMAEVRLERIMAGNDLTDISYLTTGLAKSRSVGRVVIRDHGRVIGYGTGFLVAPGVLMTNRHVLKNESFVRDSSVQFGYERDASGTELEPVEFAFRIDPLPIIDQALDMALVRVETASTDGQPLDSFGWLRLNPSPGKTFVGEYLTIIQHPRGERKQICVRENKLLKFDDNSPFLWYQTDTVGGSSGSPAFNGSWDVVALHHSSVPRTKRVGRRDVWLTKDGSVWSAEMGDGAVDWIANEGVRISRIVEFLARRHDSHALSREVREATESPAHEALATPFGTRAGGGGIQVIKDRKGNTRVFLPVEIDIKLGIGENPEVRETRIAAAPAPAQADGSPMPTPGGGVDEAVEIDKTNYGKRNGYDPKFLGDGLVVPLPKVASTKFGKPLKIKGNSTVLDYWNYSVVMNADRGLAFFSAANVFPKNPNTSQDGNKFERDPRVDQVKESAQIGKEFYKKQEEFEAEDRTRNPFDQGHLSRREYLQWGKTKKVAKRNGDDSFHSTNCAPQHFEFNQNRKASGIWYRLEKSAVDALSVGDNLCIINGPVFDAPLCKPDADGILRLNLGGARKPDQTFGGVKIPKLYFKVVAYNDDGELRAKAFVVTQEDLLKTVDRLHADEAAALSDAEIRLYQVKVPDLQSLTGLTFGLPASALAPSPEERTRIDDGRPIESESDLFFA